MYSSVAAHHNYTAGGDKLSNRQQQEQEQEQQDDQNNQQEDGGVTRRHSGRHHRRHLPITTRLFNYIKQQFHPEKDTGKQVCRTVEVEAPFVVLRESQYNYSLISGGLYINN